MTLKVRLLGRPRIEDADGRPGRPARGQKSWALLALADRPPTRAELAAELFGEADDPLGALRWGLADLRRCTGDPALLRGDPVRVGDQDLWIDVRALLAGALPAAEIGGTLLDGVELRNCPAFDLWLMLARGRCSARSAEELRRAALSLLGTGDAEAPSSPPGGPRPWTRWTRARRNCCCGCWWRPVTRPGPRFTCPGAWTCSPARA
jgi:DNA-binding SARP family transcriptional activator